MDVGWWRTFASSLREFGSWWSSYGCNVNCLGNGLDLNRWGIKFSGLPFHLTFDNRMVRWKNVLPVIRARLRNESYYIIDGWKFNFLYGDLYKSELPYWEKEYLPPDGVKDKIVLDIGAGAGETAKFFLDRGAKRVIAVENNPVALFYLHQNAKDRPITVCDKSFEVSMLRDFEHDFMKMDIEGYEMTLITEDALSWYNKDCVVEIHCQFIFDELSQVGFSSNPYKKSSDHAHVLARMMWRWKKS